MPKKRNKRKKKQNVLIIAVYNLFKLVFLTIFMIIKYFSLAIIWAFKKVFLSWEKKEKKKKDEKKQTSEKKDEKQKNKIKKFSLPAVYSQLTPKKVIKGNFSEFSERLSSKSLILTIVGKRGSGKSALGFRILENIHAKNKRPCFALGVKQSVLPKWIKSIDSIETVAESGVLLVDEGALSFSSRKSMTKKNKELSDLLTIARHKDLTLILITQNTGMIDKNVINLSDAILLKEGSLLQQKMERSSIKKFYEIASNNFDEIPDLQRTSYFYLFDSSVECFVFSELPSFWSESVSKSKK